MTKPNQFQRQPREVLERKRKLILENIAVLQELLREVEEELSRRRSG
jgi:hypothetical protein